MEHSAQIDQIAGALAKAQAQFGRLVADKTAKIKGKGADYSYTYADLADALEACRSTLSAAGIAVVQDPSTSKANGIELRTWLFHESGQWMASSTLFMPVTGGAQAVGSAITYARRYQLLAIVGLAPDDDDGAGAQANAPKKWRDEPPQPRVADPRCIGKGQALGDAVAADVRALAEAHDLATGKAFAGALKRAGVDLAAYGDAPPRTPYELRVADGQLVHAWAAGALAATAEPGPSAKRRVFSRLGSLDLDELAPAIGLEVWPASPSEAQWGAAADALEGGWNRGSSARALEEIRARHLEELEHDHGFDRHGGDEDPDHPDDQ